jgi:hypothetical protein
VCVCVSIAYKIDREVNNTIQIYINRHTHTYRDGVVGLTERGCVPRGRDRCPRVECSAVCPLGHALGVSVCMSVCMSACMYVCMYMYVCMCRHTAHSLHLSLSRHTHTLTQHKCTLTQQKCTLTQHKCTLTHTLFDHTYTHAPGLALAASGRIARRIASVRPGRPVRAGRRLAAAAAAAV